MHPDYGRPCKSFRMCATSSEKQKKGDLSDEVKPEVFKALPPRLPALLFAFDVYKRSVKAGLESGGTWDEEKVEG